MFWLGVTIGVVGGLLGIPLWRSWIQLKLCQATDRAFDILRSTFIILGAMIAIASYIQSSRENQTLQGDLKSTQISLESTQNSLNKAQGEITATSQELKLSQEKQVAAEQKLREVQEQQRARTITQEQLRVLVQRLREGPKGKVQVNSTAGDPESMQFADQLSAVLKNAGWTVDPVQPQLAAVSFMGIALEMNPETSPHGEFLQRTLHAARINSLVRKIDSSNGVVNLTVGPKPQPRW